MACLIDTGVLLRAFDRSSAEYPAIRQAIRTLRARQERFVVAAQNLAEFWNASTRPVDKNGYGLLIEQVARRLAAIERICQVITEDQRAFRVWKDLLRAYSISGVAVHDARLVVVMQAQDISTIITLNDRDFRRYQGLVVLTPTAV